MTTEVTDMKHTHRGTCQACGRVQAIQLRNEKIAKHGYTVDWGYFFGTCGASEMLPLERDKTYTENLIHVLRNDEAPRSEKRAADLKAGVILPRFSKSKWEGGKFRHVTVDRAELSDYEAAQCLTRDVAQAESHARHCRAHADMLQKLIAQRHGQPLIPVEHVETVQQMLKPGVRVNRYGTLCEVVEVRYQVARGCGPYLNGRSVLHAILKRPDGQTFAVPTRSIRRSAIVEGGAA